MSLRDFLLDYAEKAPKAERFDRTQRIRFDSPSDDNFLPLCPLELACGLSSDTFVEAADRYELSEEERDVIADAADGVDGDAERAWRAILEKLAEPEVRS